MERKTESMTKFESPLYHFCFLFLVILSFIAKAHGQTRGSSKPNVLVILTDDQGWGDLSLNGNVNLSTPNIDSLAREGAVVDSFYVCQVCAPTRAEFLTGRYYPRTGVSGVSVGQERLNPEETTLADVFQAAGYATGCFGKWHNGTQSPYHPNDRGFDEFYGFTSGHWGHYFSPPLDRNGQIVRGEGFVVDDFTNQAIRFIKAHRETPFFCYLPLNTPHSPMMVPDRFYEKFKGSDLPMRHMDSDREDPLMTRAALAMVENIDWNVGRILAVLSDLKLDEETIVIFFSDNGPNSYRWNGGMKGKKGAIDEGGVRSPCLVKWPHAIPGGLVVEQIAGAIDWLPTLLELTGVKTVIESPIDGVSFAPWLLGKETEVDERTIFSVRKNQVSVRRGSFRLDDSGRLFDVKKDPGQKVDVSARHPGLTEQLTELANAHREEMAEEFKNYVDRPFTVGYRELTVLPARDGIPHGAIERSSKAPNNSFFENWSDESGSITWDIDIHEGGVFEAVLFYTCRQEDLGAKVLLQLERNQPDAASVPSLRMEISQAFDPALYDKSKERVEKSHYFVKDFKPLSLGKLQLPEGRAILRLSAEDFVGDEAVDVHSIQLIRNEN